MLFDLAIFMGVPLGLSVLALTFGVDTSDGDDWVSHNDFSS
ncbi:MAG: hypothetical protein QOG04_70 [Actinomycetota bacterium]|jgi:hypothetical protein|nr:hypothetical protein [Actinomycetota bacterium]